MPMTNEDVEAAERRLSRAQLAASKPGSSIDADLQFQQARVHYYRVQLNIASSENKSLKRENRKLQRRLERASGNDNRHKGSGKPVRRNGNKGSSREQADKDWTLLTAANAFRSANPEDDQPTGQGTCVGGSIRAFRDGKPTYRTQKLHDRSGKRPALQVPGLGTKAG